MARRGGARTSAALGQDLEPRTSCDEDDEREEEVHDRNAHARERQEDAWEVHLVTSALFDTRLALASPTALAKYVQGRSAEYVKIGYGTPFDGKFAKRPKTKVKTTIVEEG
jgi:hypothetical protein